MSAAVSASWVSYLLLVGALAAVGAWCVEGLCRLAGRPTRWPWAAALVFVLVTAVVAPREPAAVSTVMLPTATATTLPKQVAPEGGLAAIAARVSEARMEAATVVRETISRVALAAPEGSARWFARGWALLAVVLAALCSVVYLRVRRARAVWPRETLHGVPVRVSPRAGPAVVGLANPEVVVPRWLLDEPLEAQRLVLAHEAEHLRARDPLLLASACAAAILLPWHPAVWWALARLRLAVEVDCDRRVLRAGAPRGRYGALLIDLAGHDAMLPIGAPALADRRTHLERRLLAMTAPKSRFPLARGLALGALAATALVAACEARVPTAAEVEKMDVKEFEKAAQGVKIADGSIVYFVDGVKTTPEMARNLSPEKIASVRVLKATLRDGATEAERSAAPSRIQITTLDGVSEQPLEVERATTTEGVRLRKTIPDGKTMEESALHSKVRVSHEGGTPIFFIDGKRSTPEAVHSLSGNVIESIEVLKGAAAIKAYGAEATSGAIVVKTKKQ